MWTEVMNENEFWTIIEQSRSASVQHTFLVESLAKLSLDDIISFQIILKAKIAEACTPDMIEANFLIRGYISDDEFEEFRAWLVFNGRQRFTTAVTNVETIADWLSPEETDNIDGAMPLFVAQEVYKKYGDEEVYLDKLYEHPNIVMNPKIEHEWPKSTNEFQRKYPRLYEAFWNPSKYALQG